MSLSKECKVELRNILIAAVSLKMQAEDIKHRVNHYLDLSNESEELVDDTIIQEAYEVALKLNKSAEKLASKLNAFGPESDDDVALTGMVAALAPDPVVVTETPKQASVGTSHPYPKPNPPRIIHCDTYSVQVKGDEKRRTSYLKIKFHGEKIDPEFIVARLTRKPRGEEHVFGAIGGFWVAEDETHTERDGEMPPVKYSEVQRVIGLAVDKLNTNFRNWLKEAPPSICLTEAEIHPVDETAEESIKPYITSVECVIRKREPAFSMHPAHDHDEVKVIAVTIDGRLYDIGDLSHSTLQGWNCQLYRPNLSAAELVSMLELVRVSKLFTDRLNADNHYARGIIGVTELKLEGADLQPEPSTASSAS